MDRLMVAVNCTEGVLRWARIDKVARWPFYGLAKCRQRLSEGRTRRLLRKAVRSWLNGGLYTQDYFYDHDLKVDLRGQMIVVTIEYKAAPSQTKEEKVD